MWVTTFCAVVLFALIGREAVAQEANLPAGDPTEAIDPAAETSPASPVTNEQLQRELEALRSRMERLEDAQDDMEFSLEGQESKGEPEDELEDIKSRLEHLEEAEYDENFGNESMSKKLSVYGFFDLTFSKYVLFEDTIFKGLMNESASFLVQQLNLYFYAQLTDSLTALAELRFTFLPLGQETELAVPSYGARYERVDTEVQNPFTDEKYRLGGVMIERAQLTWRPKEWFGVIAGRYLTPYGIWNVDHGSPVLIPIRHPFIRTQEYIPLAQTGVQVIGRFFPAKNTFLDYGLTVSNGRGPIESVMDYDDEMGLGLRLRLAYEGPLGTAALGGYLYRGHYTDIEKQIKSTDPFRVETVRTEVYDETVGSLDLLVEFFGLRLQAEFVRGFIQYADRYRPLRPPVRGVGDRQPDFFYGDFYTMLAYTLPLSSLLGDKTITPYVLYEYTNFDDTLPKLIIGHIFLGGINFKPSPYVVLKLEYTYKMTSNWEDAKFSVIAAQMAVSF